MQPAPQCAGASATGRSTCSFCDISTFRGHQHLSLPSSLRLRSVKQLKTASLLSSAQLCCSHRHLVPRSRPPCRQAASLRCCASSSTCDKREHPTHSRALERTKALAKAFILCCCITWLLKPTIAVASVTSALTSAGASRAAAHGAVRSGYAGLAAGCLHSLAGVDHLAALAPFTIGRSHVTASLLGALWGFGHSAGQLFMGLLMIILKDRFQHIVPALDRAGNLTVGLTLVAIGVLGVREAIQHQKHHAQVSQPVTTEGVLIQDVVQKRPERSGWRYSLGIFATGVVHGCNPDALFVIIPALTLPTKLAAMTYTLMFVIGTVGAMGGYTALIGAASSRASDTVNSRLAGFASMLAVVVGLAILLSGWGLALPFGLTIGGL